MHLLIKSYNSAYDNASPKKMYEDENLEKEYIAKWMKQRVTQDFIKDFKLEPVTYIIRWTNMI